MRGRQQSSEPTSRSRDERRRDEGSVELESGPAAAPPLGRGFSRATRAWWKTWCASPQAGLFMATDWQRLRMTAKLVEAFWAAEDPKVAKELLGEIRLNEQKLGATPEDRLRLRWRMSANLSAEDRAGKQAEAETPARRRDPRLTLVKGRSS